MKSKLIIVLAVVFILSILLYNPIVIALTTENIVITVTKTDIKRNDDSDTYLVYTDNETFQNSDSFWNFKWNSSDLHGKLKNDSTYKVQVHGIRVPYLSIYRNIIKIDE